jgi:hypothetical protein
VSAVKALLAATKDERTKRGKYFKYSQELRDEIAVFALVTLFVTQGVDFIQINFGRKLRPINVDSQVLDEIIRFSDTHVKQYNPILKVSTRRFKFYKN